jgi:hypothetical protein
MYLVVLASTCYRRPDPALRPAAGVTPPHQKHATNRNGSPAAWTAQERGSGKEAARPPGLRHVSTLNGGDPQEIKVWPVQGPRAGRGRPSFG